MQIDQELCVGCGLCSAWCPVNAIDPSAPPKKLSIDQDRCVECGTCRKVSVCPTDAIYQPELKWPRSIRSIFSDPWTLSKEKEIGGRGTEEMKTNDVTGRFKRGEVGFAIDLGRPNVSVVLKDAEKIAMAISKVGVEWEPRNPMTKLMKDETARLNEDLLNERVLSCILEFKTDMSRVKNVLKTLQNVQNELNTVFSVGVIQRVEQDWSIPVLNMLEEEGLEVRESCKTNIGLGRPLSSE